jgi:hypothetical protein
MYQKVREESVDRTEDETTNFDLNLGVETVEEV